MSTALQRKIQKTQQMIDALKNPIGWRDLRMLDALDELLDIVRQVVGLTERPAGTTAGDASDDLGRSRSQGERRKARMGTQTQPKLTQRGVKAGVVAERRDAHKSKSKSVTQQEFSDG